MDTLKAKLPCLKVECTLLRSAQREADAEVVQLCEDLVHALKAYSQQSVKHIAQMVELFESRWLSVWSSLNRNSVLKLRKSHTRRGRRWRAVVMAHTAKSQNSVANFSSCLPHVRKVGASNAPADNSAVSEHAVTDGEVNVSQGREESSVAWVCNSPSVVFVVILYLSLFFAA